MEKVTEEAPVKRPLRSHGSCFVCGPENDKGMNLTYWQEGEATVARFSFSEHEQGPPRHAHGGAISAVLDECMGKVAWVRGFRALAANLSIDFRNPTPLATALTATAWVERSEESKVYLRSELRRDDSGVLLAEGTAVFIVPKTFWQDLRKPESGVG